jgi:predicted metal-dependent HD superfamily phosphohydrolase
MTGEKSVKAGRQEQARRLTIVKEYAEVHMPKFPYHNPGHAIDIVTAIDRMAEAEGVGRHDRYLLETAGYLHDIVYVPNAKDNEEKSAEIASKLLPGLGYSKEDVEKVKSLIMATKLPASPKTLLEMIICDADLDSLGRKDCIEKSMRVKEELAPEMADDRWIESTIKFIGGHRYYTSSARSLRDAGKKRNIAALERERSKSLLRLQDHRYNWVTEEGEVVPVSVTVPRDAEGVPILKAYRAYRMEAEPVSAPQHALTGLSKNDAFLAAVNLFAIEMTKRLNSRMEEYHVIGIDRHGEAEVLGGTNRVPDNLDKQAAKMYGLRIVTWDWNGNDNPTIYLKEAGSEATQRQNGGYADPYDVDVSSGEFSLR